MSKKVIKIDDKDYEVACNALTRFNYKKIFGVGLFADIKLINDFNIRQKEYKDKLMKDSSLTAEEIEEKVNNEFLGEMDALIDVIERLAYIEVFTANPNFGTFEDFLGGIENINLSADWISEVTELAVDSFRG